MAHNGQSFRDIEAMRTLVRSKRGERLSDVFVSISGPSRRRLSTTAITARGAQPAETAREGRRAGSADWKSAEIDICLVTGQVQVRAPARAKIIRDTSADGKD